MFVNHDISKITLEFPIISPLVIYLVLLFLGIGIFGTTQEKDFLSRIVTDQLRGFAMLLIIVGHIGVHVIAPQQQTYFPVFGQYGVAIFFILSGFGLTRSYYNKPLLFRHFMARRLKKVMIPYWIITIVILCIDYIVLEKTYTWTDLILSGIGINFSNETRHIDYVRWYITVLLLWYIIFMFLWRINNSHIKSLVFIIIGFLLVFVNYYLLRLGYAYLSFPVGVIIGIYHYNIKNIYDILNNKYLLYISLFIFILNISYFTFLKDIVDIVLPTIAMVFISEILWISIFIALLNVFVIFYPLFSRFFIIFGTYSYGLFLLHGVIMIRYDMFLYKYNLYISFWIYLTFALLISIFFHKYILNKLNI